jgi:hypothetical protein
MIIQIAEVKSVRTEVRIIKRVRIAANTMKNPRESGGLEDSSQQRPQPSVRSNESRLRYPADRERRQIIACSQVDLALMIHPELDMHIDSCSQGSGTEWLADVVDRAHSQPFRFGRHFA